MKYENPICEILYLKSSDIISTSGGDTSLGGVDPDGDPNNIEVG